MPAEHRTQKAHSRAEVANIVNSLISNSRAETATRHAKYINSEATRIDLYV